MIPVHPVRGARVRVPLQGGAAGEPVCARLYGSAAPRAQEPLGTWEFAPGGGPVAGVEVDLWRLDVHTVQLAAPSGGRPAHAFRGSADDVVSGRLRLELVLEGQGGRRLHQVELALDGEELAGLRGRLHQSSVPLIEWFFVELTNHCNLACPWCPSAARMKRPRGSMALERARQLWSQIAAYRAAHPRFALYAEVRNQVFLHVMGEALLHPQFFEIVDEGHRLGLDFCLVTNASILRGPRLERLLDSGIKAVVVSLNVTDSRQYRQVRSATPHREVVAQIQELIAARHRRRSASPRIEIQLLCTEGVALPGRPSLGERAAVEAELASWARFVRGEEARSGWVAARAGDLAAPASLLPGDGELDARHTIGENVSVVVKRACNFANALLPEGASVLEALHGRCPAQNPSRVLCVLWDGTCTFCTLDYDGEVGLGNVFERGIEAIWADPRLRRIRRLMDRGVAVEPLCQRCFGTVQPGDGEKSFR